MRLAQADSLFALHAYTQAYRHYSALYEEGYVSARMLLRMAYIQEALQAYPLALYYLLDYYALRPRTHVLNKITALAKTQGLTGYEMNIATQCAYIVHKYRFWVVIGLLLLFVCGWVAHWRKKRSISLILMVASLSLCVFLWYSALWMPQYGLQQQSEAIFLHKGPSGASPTIRRIPPGARLSIQKTSSVWTHIQYDNTQGYVRSHYLKKWPIR